MYDCFWYKSCLRVSNWNFPVRMNIVATWRTYPHFINENDENNRIIPCHGYIYIYQDLQRRLQKAPLARKLIKHPLNLEVIIAPDLKVCDVYGISWSDSPKWDYYMAKIHQPLPFRCSAACKRLECICRCVNLPEDNISSRLAHMG